VDPLTSIVVLVVIAGIVGAALYFGYKPEQGKLTSVPDQPESLYRRDEDIGRASPKMGEWEAATGLKQQVPLDTPSQPVEWPRPGENIPIVDHEQELADELARHTHEAAEAAIVAAAVAKEAAAAKLVSRKQRRKIARAAAKASAASAVAARIALLKGKGKGGSKKRT
jgi:hypothetical protein